MRFKPSFILIPLILAAVCTALLYQPTSNKTSVVVYSSVDADVALRLFELFTQQTGITVIPRLDGEETKTTGLALRLEQMKDHPDGDVFWNSELSFTQVLSDRGVLDTYVSPNASEIPLAFKDPSGHWAGFGCRARVVIYNTNRVKPDEVPKSLDDFSAPRWKGRFAVAKPLYGTTRSHLTALFLELGEEKAPAFFRAWRENGVIIAESNGDVRDRVADGTADIGLTDTDDAFSALDRKKPVNFKVLSQTQSWPGAFLIPNSVALLKNAPHSSAGKKFIDFLLRPETERWLAEHEARQIPVRATGAKLPPPLDKMDLKPAAYDTKRCADNVLVIGERIFKILSGEER